MATATAMAVAPTLHFNPLYKPSPSPLPSSPLPLRRHGFNAAMRKSTRPRRRDRPLPLIVPYSIRNSTPKEGQDEEEEEEYSVLTSLRTEHNEIVIVDTAKSRVLLLDSTHNIHSILNKGQKWTGSYWDDFATLPAIVPKGPIAILGLGGGTAAHLLLEIWPSLHLEGWEIDQILIDKARYYFGLADLEKATKDGGFLSVHVGDALSPSAIIPGGFAGILVDLFSDGKVLPQLQEVATWLELEKRLSPNGRIMVNCAGAHVERSTLGGEGLKTTLPSNGSWIQNSTIKTLCKAFPGNLSWKRMAEDESENFLALTGPLPDLNAWSAAVPSQLSSNVKQWRPCELA
ncbi:hypothetical protein QJS10_CPA01g00459 [Acorus calamus]|uniref:S-adenosyl-L-methionine-dependent methyltransferase n=1 Tax=Acorus calamus TaxID=4465 RepID=A0AAV9FM72_ACOCL|nr:hypothetical protein QJS10_CPA01g00459 [Acorus calamus]